MSDITAQAAEHNRNAWNSFRRQRDEGLSQERRDSAEDILQGKGYLGREYIMLAGDVSGKRLLDMGCGEAAETLEWARLGAQVTGVDNSPKQLEAARRNAEKLGIDCRLVQADLLRLPRELMRGEFDIVFSSWVTAWIGNKGEWFRSAYRALKPGGIFLLGGGHPLGAYIRDIEEGDLSQDSYFSEGPLHIESKGKNAFNPAGEPIKTIEWCHMLGTIVTAVAQASLRVTHLLELPAAVGEAELPLAEKEKFRHSGLPVGFVLRAVKE